MSRFFADAIRVLETAAQGASDDFGILVDDSGALRIVAAQGWRPDALQAHYGARSVFQVSHGPTGVRVDARSGQYSCTLSKETGFGGGENATRLQHGLSRSSSWISRHALAMG